jgi:predicted permease
MIRLQPVGINRPEDIYLSGTVLLFTTVVSVLVAIAFGIFPALQAARVDENATIQPLGHRRSTAPSNRLRRSLITAEVALTCVLLIGATFMIKSFSAALRVDPGFRPDHLLTMKFSMPPSHYPNNEAIGAFCRQVLDKVSTIPGVKSASFSDGLPLTRIRMTKFTVEGRPEPVRGSEPTADMRGIFSAQYFDALGLRFISGRNFSAEEIDHRRPVVVINQALSQKLWPNESAIGQHIRSVPSKTQPEPVVSTVIGVVANTHQMSLEEGTRPEITKPMVDFTQLTLAVRSESAPQTLVSAVKNQIWSVDRYLPVFEVQTMEEVMNSTLSQRKFNATVMSLFGSLALLLAAVGIYGVISSIAMQRTQEIGIRVALGAQRHDVLTLILRQGIRQLLLGLAIGLAAGWMVSRSLASIFFGVTPTNMTTYLQVAVLLTVIGLMASLLPALRAMRVSPVDALRQE